MNTRWWQPVLFGTLAGGMGWGIRGQYGHETGAMLAGLLLCVTLAYLLCPRREWPALFRAVAWGTLAMGFGGSMTYGQTLGLTQNAQFIGNGAAWWWGMLGCAVKGGLWIGFAGVFFGMGLGGKRYKPGELLVLMLALVGAFYMGNALFNGPFDPAAKELPRFYFSADWYWQPDAGAELDPREEVWGGLLAAWLVITVYVASKGDRLGRNLSLWGLLGGAIGFPLGQCIQSYHAWHPAVFQGGLWTQLAPHMNWWNMMEMTFGATMGAVLGFGLWLNRHKIDLKPLPEEDRLSLPWELIALAVHVPLLIAVTFLEYRAVDVLYDWGLVMGIIPVAAIAGGRFWPCLQMLPLTLIPIAGLTLQDVAYEGKADSISPAFGWAVYVIVPVGLALVLALILAVKAARNTFQRDPLGPLVVVCAWLYFLLNFAIFRFPWPWEAWTGRTPSGLIMAVCVVGLTLMVAFGRRHAPINSPVTLEEPAS